MSKKEVRIYLTVEEAIDPKKFEEVFGFNPIGYVFRGEFSDAWWNQEYKEPKS